MPDALKWQVECLHWRQELSSAQEATSESAFQSFRRLANTRMDFVRTNSLDLAVQRYLQRNDTQANLSGVKLALLGSSTLGHLVSGIRVAALRRGVLVEVQVGEYGMYQQEILQSSSPLHSFQPDVVVLALDAQHLASGRDITAEGALSALQDLWHSLKQTLGCLVIQQTILPTLLPVMGNQEHLLRQSPAAVVQQINAQLRTRAAEAGVLLLTVDTWAAEDGLAHWHDSALWLRSKQDVHPRATVTYGEQIGRILAASKGLSAKCLVLDLDNTLWGGVIGDDGLNGIVLGQGSTVGEAHVALQRYALQLAERGIILAVCSKNDETNATAPFDSHPDMVLRRKDIACFVANWQDKATNLRTIAEQLNIGLDSLVFVDDNPAERSLIRRELPMVAVPELPDDPAGFVSTLAAAGYFEAVHVTEEDRQRTTQYKANAERESLRVATTDIAGYLRALEMQLHEAPFDEQGLQRIVQLNNKTNQFNLTTLRYSESDVLARMHDPKTITMQLRLSDTYGDNGVIGLVVGTRGPAGELDIETWLMSCRVLGRNVEQATLNILAQRALTAGYTTLRGIYRPTAKNSMVRQHYASLGFLHSGATSDGVTFWKLDLQTFTPFAVPMEILESAACKTTTSIAA